MPATHISPVPPGEEIERLAKSLKEEMGYKMKYLHLKRKGINGFIFVAAFIASIQALIFSFTKDSNGTSFERATNIVGLFGIIFDVTGAVLGATYVLVMLDSIEDGHILLIGIHRVFTEIFGLNLCQEKILQIEAQLSDLETMRRERWRYVPDPSLGPQRRRLITRLFLDLAEKISFSIMGLGVACLLISVVMFSGMLGFPSIWIPCLILACVVSFIAVAPLKTLLSKTSVREALRKLQVKRDLELEAKREMELEAKRKALFEQAYKPLLHHDEKKVVVETRSSIAASENY